MAKLRKIQDYTQVLVHNAGDVLADFDKVFVDKTTHLYEFYLGARWELHWDKGIQRRCESVCGLLQPELGGYAGPMDWDRAHSIRHEVEILVRVCRSFLRRFENAERYILQEGRAQAQEAKRHCWVKVMDPATRMLNLARKLQRAVESQRQCSGQMHFDHDEDSADDGGVGEEPIPVFGIAGPVSASPQQATVARQPPVPIPDSALPSQIMLPKRPRKGSCIIL